MSDPKVEIVESIGHGPGGDRRFYDVKINIDETVYTITSMSDRSPAIQFQSKLTDILEKVRVYHRRRHDHYAFSLICLGALLGHTVYVGLPKLWEVIKPMIHNWTQ